MSEFICFFLDKLLWHVNFYGVKFCGKFRVCRDWYLLKFSKLKFLVIQHTCVINLLTNVHGARSTVKWHLDIDIPSQFWIVRIHFEGWCETMLFSPIFMSLKIIFCMDMESRQRSVDFENKKKSFDVSCLFFMMFSLERGSLTCDGVALLHRVC